MQKKLARFIKFYRDASAQTFLGLAAADFLWALESLASYAVNRWKFTGPPKGKEGPTH